jgi:hypothetical protein
MSQSLKENEIKRSYSTARNLVPATFCQPYKAKGTLPIIAGVTFLREPACKAPQNKPASAANQPEHRPFSAANPHCNPSNKGMRCLCPKYSKPSAYIVSIMSHISM